MQLTRAVAWAGAETVFGSRRIGVVSRISASRQAPASKAVIGRWPCRSRRKKHETHLCVWNPCFVVARCACLNVRSPRHHWALSLRPRAPSAPGLHLSVQRDLGLEIGCSGCAGCSSLLAADRSSVFCSVDPDNVSALSAPFAVSVSMLSLAELRSWAGLVPCTPYWRAMSIVPYDWRSSGAESTDAQSAPSSCARLCSSTVQMSMPEWRNTGMSASRFARDW